MKDRIDKVFKRFEIQECKPRYTPVVKWEKFNRNQYHENDLNKIQKISHASKSSIYSQVCTRPDIVFIVQILDKNLNNPSMDH